jgi:hypothetical protein
LIFQGFFVKVGGIIKINTEPLKPINNEEAGMKGLGTVIIA